MRKFQTPNHPRVLKGVVRKHDGVPADPRGVPEDLRDIGRHLAEGVTDTPFRLETGLGTP